ncbi:MAG TPA: hypothetical protein GXX70_00085 [Tepidimicrobium sp.]|nr:hypothetical protein [Tepidimicrobium sp.]
MKNKCEDKINIYCRQAITYKKYAQYRECNKYCLECLEPCGNICKIALDINEERAYR